MEEGCLSLPAVHVEVERPVHVRVRAQDEYGEQILIEASGLEARVIQHEMDHLDGVLILDRTSREQRKEAMRALREARRRLSRHEPSVRTVYLGTSEFAAAVLERLADSPHRPQLVVTRPDRPRGRGRSWPPPPVADAARELGLELAQPARSTTRARAGSPRPRPSVLRLRLRRADQGAAAVATIRCSTSIRRCCRAGAVPLRSSGRSWPATTDTGVSIMRAHRRPRQRPDCPQASEPIGPRTPTARSPRAWSAIGGELLVARSTSRPPCAEQDEARVTYAEKITAEDRRARSARPADELERTRARADARTSAPTSRARRAPLGVQRARVGAAGRRLPSRRESSSLDGPRPVLGCADGALELLVVQPPGGGRCAARTTCAGAGEPRRSRPGSAPSRRRGPAPTRSCAGCSSRARSPTGRSRPRPASSTRATGRWPWRSPTAPSSAARRSTTSPQRFCQPAARAARPAGAGGPAARPLPAAFLDGVADHAAVNESVELAKRTRRGARRPGQRRAAPRGPGGPGDRWPSSTTPPARRRGPALGPGLAGRALVDGARGRGSAGAAGLVNEPAESAMRVNTLVTGAGRRGARRCRSRAHPAPGLPEGLVLEAAVRRPRLGALAARARSCRSRARRCWSPACSRPAPASACSTSALRPAARRRTSRR